MSEEDRRLPPDKNLTGRARVNWDYRKKHLPRLRHYNLWNNCRQRAKKKGLEFSLDKSDIVVPEFCPILGIKLEHGFEDTSRECSPSVDRIDLRRGYTPDNIQVISYLANRMKNNATLEQLVLLRQWAEKTLKDTNNGF